MSVLSYDDKQMLDIAGFESGGREGWVRGGLARREFIGVTGPHGRYYACIYRKVKGYEHTFKSYLRGERGGMRMFKTVLPLIEALDAKRLQEVCA